MGCSTWCDITSAQIKSSERHLKRYSNVYSEIENTTKYVTNIKFDINWQTRRWSPVNVLSALLLLGNTSLLQYELNEQNKDLDILIFILWAGFLFKWFLQENIGRSWTESRNRGQPRNPGELSILYYVSWCLSSSV